MKKLLCLSMMIFCAGVFGSGDKQERQSKIQQLQVEYRKIEAEKTEETAKITRAIKQEEDALFEIKENERLQREFGRNKEKARLIKEAFEFAQNYKERDQRSYDDEYSCETTSWFLYKTYERKLVARKLIDAMEGRVYNDTMGIFTCCCCVVRCMKASVCGFFCCYPDEPNSVDWCGDYQDRLDATYLRNGAMLLALEKLQQLAVRQSTVGEKLHPVAQSEVRSEIVEDPVESLIMDRKEFSANEEKSE